MPAITLPDGNKLNFTKEITGLEIAEKISKSLLKSIGTEGRKNIVQKFNVEKMCFSTYSEYKRLLN